MVSILNNFSSGLRHAERANRDLMNNQRILASGSKGESIKDDAGKYLFNQAVNSKHAENEARTHIYALMQSETSLYRMQNEVQIDAMDKMKNLAKSALQFAQGSSARKAIQAEYTQAYGEFVDVIYPAIIDVAGSPVANPNDPLQTSLGVGSTGGSRDPHWLGWFANAVFGVNFETVDIVNVDNSTLSYLAYGLGEVQGYFRTGANQCGRWEAGWETALNIVEKDEMILEKAANSIVGVDLGTLAAQSEKLNTKYELAMTTIGNALEQYRRYSTSVLSMVTQNQLRLRG